jgi:hypothetical protein
VQLPHQRFIDLAAGKVEAGKIAIGREPRDLELIGHGSHFTFSRLGFKATGRGSAPPPRRRAIPAA